MGRDRTERDSLRQNNARQDGVGQYCAGWDKTEQDSTRLKMTEWDGIGQDTMEQVRTEQSMMGDNRTEQYKKRLDRTNRCRMGQNSRKGQSKTGRDGIGQKSAG